MPSNQVILCHPPFSSCPQSFLESGSFQMSRSSIQLAIVSEFQFQPQSFNVIRTGRSFRIAGWALCWSMRYPCKLHNVKVLFVGSHIQPQSSPLPSFHRFFIFLSHLHIYFLLSLPLQKWSHSNLEGGAWVYLLMNKILTHLIQNRQLGRCLRAFFFLLKKSFLPFLLPSFFLFFLSHPLNGFSEARCHSFLCQVYMFMCVSVYYMLWWKFRYLKGLKKSHLMRVTEKDF